MKHHNTKRWTEDEIKILETDFENRLPIAEIANKLDRSSQAITNKIQHLGLTKPIEERAKHKEEFRRGHRRSYSKYMNTLNGRLSRLVRQARQRNKECNLTLDYLMDLYYAQKGKCKYSGLIMEYEGVEKRDFNLISIDRVDSTKGYTKDNVVLCCWGVNRIKAELSVDEFIKTCKLIVNENNKSEPEYTYADCGF